MIPTWTLVIIFSWVVPQPGVNPTEVAHSGMSVPGFTSREACKTAQEILMTPGSKSACVASRVWMSQ